MSAPAPGDIRSVDLDAQLKTTLTRLCRAHGLPHSGVKAQLLARLRHYRDRLPPSSPAADPRLSSPRSLAHQSPTPSPTPQNPPLPPVPQPLAPPSTSQPPVPTPQPLVPSPAPPLAPQPLVPPLAPQPLVPPLAPQPLVPPLAPQPVAPPPLLLATRSPGAVAGSAAATWPQVDVQALAQQAAQQAAARVLMHFTSPPPRPQPHNPQFPQPTLPPSLTSLPASVPGPTTGTATTTYPPWVYQPPAATPQQVLGMQSTLLPAQTATAAPSPSLTTPPLPQLAPFSGAIPSIPNRFATAAAAGEFVDFNELLHVLEVDGGEEPPISL